MFFNRNGSGGVEWLLVGLGNPGSKYESTRHNMGWLALDSLMEKEKFTLNKLRFKAWTGMLDYKGHKILVMKPQTYMNLSGRSVLQLSAYFGIPPQRIIVMFDDISLEPGRLRVRAEGSAGGHNGIKSILAHVGDEHFARVRIGIGRPLPGWTVVNHVLAGFPEEEQPKIREAIDYLIPAVECIVTHDVDMAMNQFNPKKKKKAKKVQAAEVSEAEAKENQHEQAE